MNRRHFFTRLASGLLVAAAPDLFIPKLIAPRWKRRAVALDDLPEHSLAKLAPQLILMRNLPQIYSPFSPSFSFGSGTNWNWGQNPSEDYVIVAPRNWAYRGQNKLADFAIVAEPCEAELHAEAHA